MTLYVGHIHFLLTGFGHQINLSVFAIPKPTWPAQASPKEKRINEFAPLSPGHLPFLSTFAQSTMLSSLLLVSYIDPKPLTTASTDLHNAYIKMSFVFRSFQYLVHRCQIGNFTFKQPPHWLLYFEILIVFPRDKNSIYRPTEYISKMDYNIQWSNIKAYASVHRCFLHINRWFLRYPTNPPTYPSTLWLYCWIHILNPIYLSVLLMSFVYHHEIFCI